MDKNMKIFEPLEVISRKELENRWERLRNFLKKEQPESGGIMLFSKVNIYWISGFFGTSVFWLPEEGEPYLFVRKGIQRANMESLVKNKFPYRSFSDIIKILQEEGRPLPETFSVEMSGLSWSEGKIFEKKYCGYKFFPADFIINRVRASKSEWEINKITEGGKRHFKAIYEAVKEKIKPEMNEREIGCIIYSILLSFGNCGIIRFQRYGDELFLGCVSAGDSGNYPTYFNGPVGARGFHPAVPYIGHHSKIWKKGEVLIVDSVFCFEGYLTDKTQLFFAGKESDVPDVVKRAYDFCVMLQEECAKRLVPGNLPEDLYIFCLNKAKEFGFEEGFMGLGGNKVPFVGHGIGLQLDEWPPIAKKIREPLEENMVIAIEPKIGIPEIGMVGIENTFLVTSSGGKCLTGDKFDLICIE